MESMKETLCIAGVMEEVMKLLDINFSSTTKKNPIATFIAHASLPFDLLYRKFLHTLSNLCKIVSVEDLTSLPVKRTIGVILVSFTKD